ncbi:MAG TPA: type II toxin-antitoxin system HicB family antitoxin [Dehalococcoidia bacterium]|nr:type II toxin-antitoxin system HicB family antitoxin [Dehalococcoidia bacterium]
MGSRRLPEPRHRVVIAWSPGDRTYVASVPDLPGCMAHGSTYEVALANVKDAARLWLDTAREDGLPIPAASDAQLSSA